MEIGKPQRKGARSTPEDLYLGLATAWDIFTDAFKNFQRNGDVNLAASIAFYAILSSIPLIILTILAASAVFGYNPRIQVEVIRAVQEFHPYFTGEFLIQLGAVEDKGRLLGWVGIISLVWTASLIFNSVQAALGIIFRSRERRGFFASKLLAIAMIPLGWTVGVINVGITYASTMMANKTVAANFGSLVRGLLASAVFRYALPYLLMVAFFTFVYRVMSTGKVSVRNALMGSALFSALMEITKHLYAWYMSRGTNYNIIYGSLETVVIVVIWVFYVSVILLFCAELISSYQKRDLVLLEKALLRGRGKP
jgi:membrane protein